MTTSSKSHRSNASFPLHSSKSKNCAPSNLTGQSRILSLAVMLLAIVLTASCSALGTKEIVHRVEVQRIPVMPEPNLIELPTAPRWESPPVMVVTEAEAREWAAFCEMFRTPEDKLSEDEIEQKQALIDGGSGADDFCQWAIYGFTVQHWLNFEQYMLDVAAYVDKLRSTVGFYKNQLEARQRVIAEAEARAEESLRETSGTEPEE